MYKLRKLCGNGRPLFTVQEQFLTAVRQFIFIIAGKRTTVIRKVIQVELFTCADYTYQNHRKSQHGGFCCAYSPRLGHKDV